MKTLTVSASRKYDITVTTGFGAIKSVTDKLSEAKKIAVITDDAVKEDSFEEKKTQYISQLSSELSISPAKAEILVNNGYLTAEQRKIAPGLYKVLSSIADKLQAGERDLDEIITIAGQELNEKGFRADDIQIRDADTLLEVSETSKRAVILVAAWLGDARLIDNKMVELA